MNSLRTERRNNKIVSVLKARQRSLSVVLENIHDPHNVSAIFRTCDAVGIPTVSLIYYLESFPKVGKKSSASALKWVEREKFKTVKECYEKLRKQNFRILASSISDSKDSLDIYKLDLTKKTALVFGNEHRGVSEEAKELADDIFQIPMYGMVQSLNVSVAAAVCLYEALRQRIQTGQYENNKCSDEELEELIKLWNKK